MTLGLWAMALTLPVLLLVCGALSALETALFSLSYHDRTRLAKTDPGLSRVVDRLLARPRELLVSNLLVNMISSTLFMVLTTLLAAELTNVWLQVGLAALNLLAMTLMAEVVSKMLAVRYRLAVCALLARPMLGLFLALGPLRVFLDRGVIEPISRLLLPRRTPERLSLDELASLLELGASQGAIGADEHRVLRQVIGFGSLRVRDIMTPRVDMEWLSTRATVEDVRTMVARTRLTRVPVCPAPAAIPKPGAPTGLDAGVVGFLNTKRYLSASLDRPSVKLEEFIEPVVYIPETTTLDRLLERVRGSAVKIALCVDEHGAVVGVVTAQDVVGRLVTEVGSGGSATEASGDERVTSEGPGRWSVPGRMGVHDWAQMFGLRLDPRVSTVAGFVMAQLGRLPKVGDAVTLGNLKLEVSALDGRVVDRVLVSLDDRGDSAAGFGGAGAEVRR